MKKEHIHLQRLGYGLDVIVWGLMITLLLISVQLHRKVGKLDQHMRGQVDYLVKAAGGSCGK